MKKSECRFKLQDVVLLALAALPLAFAIVLKVLYTPVSEDISITGAHIFYALDMPICPFPVTEAQINSWAVILSIFFLCLYMTHGADKNCKYTRQHFAEWIVEKTNSLVSENMGEYFKGFSPFVAAIMALSAFSSLLSLIGLYPPTSDLNVVGGWAILVFVLITYYKFKCGPVHYIKSFAEPVAFLTPLNIISEVATPVSMTFRHYGNILSGSVISVLVSAALGGLSKMIFGNVSGVFGQIPFLSIGIPAVLSVYFDVFSGALQAFIFAMLTMLYIAGGFPAELYAERHKKKLNLGGM